MVVSSELDEAEVNVEFSQLYNAFLDEMVEREKFWRSATGMGFDNFMRERERESNRSI